jgi:hypothetical protein
LHDVSRYNNWGTLTNMDAATDWVIDGGKYALDFDGSNDHVLITGARLPTVGNASTITASTWFRISSLPSGRRELTATPSIVSGNFGMQLELDAGKLKIRADTGGVAIYEFADSANSPTGEWVHAVGVWNGVSKTASLYKNGVFVGSVSYAASTATNVTSTRWTLGSLEYENVLYFYFPGLIAESITFNRVLSANEIRNLYNLGRGGMLERRRRRRVYSVQADVVKSYLFVGRGQVIGGGTL